MLDVQSGKIISRFLNWWSQAQVYDPATELIELRIRRNGSVVQHFLTSIDEVARLAVSSGCDSDIFFSVVPRIEKCGSKECTREKTYLLWFDLDLDKKSDDANPDKIVHRASFAVSQLIDRLNRFAGFRPKSLVATVTGHGVHVYIAVDKAVSCKALEQLRAVFANVEGIDLNVMECARTMRLPGTCNTKFKPPFRTFTLMSKLLSIMM